MRNWDTVTVNSGSFDEVLPISDCKRDDSICPTDAYGRPFPAGNYKTIFQAYDGSTVIGAVGTTEYFTIDNTAPDVSLTSPTASVVNGIVEVKGTITDNNPDHYWFVIQNSSNVTVAGPGTVYSAPQAFTDHSLLNWDTSGLPSGDYTITLSARDAANNKDAGSTAKVTVTVDNTAPTITWVAPLNSDTGLSGDVLFDVDCDGTPGDCNYINFWWWNSATQTINDARTLGQYHYEHTDGTDFSWTIDSIDPELWLVGTGSKLDGDYILRAAGKDTLGNYHHEQIMVDFDNTAPSSDITHPDGGSSNTIYLNDWDGVVSGTSDDENSGVAKVWLSIQRDNGTGDYWNGTAWQTAEVTFETTYDGNTNSDYDWTYDFKTALGGGDIPEDSY